MGTLFCHSQLARRAHRKGRPVPLMMSPLCALCGGEKLFQALAL